MRQIRQRKFEVINLQTFLFLPGEDHGQDLVQIHQGVAVEEGIIIFSSTTLASLRFCLVFVAS